MKKRKILLFTSFLIISFLILNSILAAEIPNPKDTEAFQTAEKIKKTTDTLTNKEITSEYLSREWTNWLRNNGYLNWVYKTNPFFQFLFGQEFSLSWAFIAAIIIWLGIIFIYYPALNTFIEDQISALAAAILIGSITTNLLTQKILEFSGKIAKTATSAIIYILLLLVLIVIIKTIMKTIKKVIEKAKAKVDLKAAKQAHEDVETLKQVGKGFNEASRDWGSMNKYKK